MKRKKGKGNPDNPLSKGKKEKGEVEGMKKFINWGIEKKYWSGYGYTGKMELELFIILHGKYFYFDKQSMIGYKIEYLLLNGFMSWRRLGGWLEEKIKERAFWKKGIVLNGDNYIEVLNDILDTKIKEIDK